MNTSVFKIKSVIAKNIIILSCVKIKKEGLPWCIAKCKLHTPKESFLSFNYYSKLSIII